MPSDTTTAPTTGTTTTTTPTTGTTTSAADAQDGFCRFVYGDVSNPLRMEVFTGDKWIALKGISSVSPLSSYSTSPPVVARVEFSDLTMVASSRVTLMGTETAD